MRFLMFNLVVAGALVYLLSGDAAWGVVAGIAVLTLAPGIFYYPLTVDEVG